MWSCILTAGVLPEVSLGATLISLEPLFIENELQLKLVFDEVPTYRVWRNHTPSKVIIDVEAVPAVELPPNIDIHDVAVQQVRLSEGPLGFRAVVDLAYAAPLPITQTDDTSIVVRVPVRFQTIDEIFVHPGVRYGTVRMGQEHGPVSANYIRVNLNHPAVHIDLAPMGSGFEVNSIRALAIRHGALAGVNGSFFHWTGRPLGLFIQDGKLITEDFYGRAALVMGTDGSAIIGHQTVEMELVLPNEKIPVDGINRPRQSGEVVLYTSDYGTLARARGRRLLIDPDGFVSDVLSDDTKALEEGAFIVEFDHTAIDQETSLLHQLQPGDPVAFEYRLVPGHDENVRLALGGGPLLLADGQINITGVQERFQSDVLLGRAPRTAIGLTANDEMLLLVVDGRRLGISNGVTLEELATLMLDLGADSAMNLDGGGSSTLVLRDRVLNQPSSGEERLVGNGLFVFIRDEN